MKYYIFDEEELEKLICAVGFNTVADVQGWDDSDYMKYPSPKFIIKIGDGKTLIRKGTEKDIPD